MIYLLVVYMWLFIHRPFEVWSWLGELRVERVYMIVTILYWAIAGDKQWISNRLNAAFAFFWIVLLASWIISPYSSQGTGAVENYLKVAVFYVLVMSTIRSEENLKLLLMMFLGAMAIYMAHSLREYHCGRGVWRMSTWRMVGVDRSFNDPNTFAATVLYSLPMVYPLWFQFRKSLFRWALAGYVLLAVTCILLTGSRAGFIGLCALTMIVVLLSKHRMKILLLLVVAAPMTWSLLPEDRQHRYLTLIDPSYGPDGAQVSAESRITGFQNGVMLWKQNPLLGVGPSAYGEALDSGQSHNLYGQVLGELGTLGAIAFGAILLGIFGNYIAMRKICRQEPEFRNAFLSRLIQAVTITAVLLLLMGLGGHNLYRYTWLWYGAFQAIALYCLNARYAEISSLLEDECIDADAYAFLDPTK